MRQEEHMMPIVKSVSRRFAINLIDLDRAGDLLRSILLVGKLDLSEPIRTNCDRMDETAVAFSCDLLSAACICDTLRNHDRRVGDHPTRVYFYRDASWEKIPGNKILVVVEGERCFLNPEIFGVQKVKVSAAELATSRMETK